MTKLHTLVRPGADPGFVLAGARTNVENQGHSSIALEMYKQYIDELRAKPPQI